MALEAPRQQCGTAHWPNQRCKAPSPCYQPRLDKPARVPVPELRAQIAAIESREPVTDVTKPRDMSRNVTDVTDVTVDVTARVTALEVAVARLSAELAALKASQPRLAAPGPAADAPVDVGKPGALTAAERKRRQRAAAKALKPA